MPADTPPGGTDPTARPSELPSGVGPRTTRAELLELITKLRRVPDEARLFVRSAAWAWALLRIHPDLLAFLVRHGMPHRLVGSEPQFDRFDLLNCAMQLGLGPLARSAHRFWPAALRRAATGVRTTYRLDFVPRCPQPGHGGECHYVLALPGGEIVERRMPAGESPSVTVLVSPRVVWPEVPAHLHDLLSSAGDLRFMMLPEDLRRDVGFLRASGLADCAGSTVLLADEARARGVTVRTSYGYIIAPPFAVEHSWAEVRVEDTWVPIDPVLICTMLSWGVLDPREWHPYRSVGPILSRVSDDEMPLTRHGGAPIRGMVVVRPVSEEAAQERSQPVR
jgi:hypothetical protein